MIADTVLPVLSPSERQAIASLPSRRVWQVRARSDIIGQGDVPSVVNLLLTGWAYRYKRLPDGRHQTLSLFLPGEVCDANVFLLNTMDHSVGALTHVQIAEISPADFSTAIADTGRLSRLLWLNDLRMMAMQREWTMSIGQRTARERIAHLFCETFFRLRYLGLTSGDSCDFPLTQSDLAEATGLTSVHVNRMLQELRADGLVEYGQRRLRIPNLPALEAAALFDATYLHYENFAPPM